MKYVKDTKKFPTITKSNIVRTVRVRTKIKHFYSRGEFHQVALG